MSAIASKPIKFTLTAGSHLQWEGEGKDRKEVLYNRGDIFYSNQELDRIHGEKFMRSPDYFPLKHGEKVIQPDMTEHKVSAKGAIPQFNSMTVEQIIEWAESEEITLDLPQGKTPNKSELIKQIRNALIPA